MNRLLGSRMTRQQHALLVVAVASPVIAGGSCAVFDEDLYKNADAGAENWSAAVDACPLPDRQLLSSDKRQHSGVLSLNTQADDYQNIGKLTGMDGPDGVLGFSVASGERVAISAKFVLDSGQSAPPVDLALWLTQSCDPETFVRRNQRCPAGVGETMWWQTTEAGSFYLGLDSKAYDQSAYSPEIRLTVTYPRFGDNNHDPGEACDDGNLVDRDGCTHDGLAEVMQAAGGNPVPEVEPNNHPTAGNVVLLESSSTIQILGDIGGSCDHDFFMLDVPEGSFPRVTVLGADGKDCPEGTPEFKLQFNQTLGDNREQAKLGDALIPALDGSGTNYCPQFDENSFAVNELAAGRYVLEFKAYDQGQHPTFHYLLRIEMLEAVAGD